MNIFGIITSSQEARIKTIPNDMVKDATGITRVGKLYNVILFAFYKKPMANKCANLKRSGIPEQMKVNTVVQECLRRLKNTSRELPLTEYEIVLRDFMGELAMGDILKFGRQRLYRAP